MKTEDNRGTTEGTGSMIDFDILDFNHGTCPPVPLIGKVIHGASGAITGGLLMQ